MHHPQDYRREEVREASISVLVRKGDKTGSRGRRGAGVSSRLWTREDRFEVGGGGSQR